MLCAHKHQDQKLTFSTILFLHLFSDPNAPSVLTAPQDVLTVAGEDVQFDCSFGGDPQPTAEWYYKQTEDSTPIGPLTNGDG